MHVHTFQDHIGMRFAGGTAIAWVPAQHVTAGAKVKKDLPHMLRCTECGEQGYGVPK